ncbi:MAG: flagellar hook-associated protein FlgL [Synergistaceae bacterium]|jgi:flagellar hook-associated protein 3 FlgL|nr:flagellar hook-associated protein FlgL [Synergistaceae bacterium]
MSYRVTNSMMQALLLNDMHNNLNNMLKIQQQMSTQRKYASASDNPNAVTKGMGIETMMTEGEQYIKNLQDAVSWLKFTDDALMDIGDIFQRMRELTIYAGDPALTDVDRYAIGEELRQLKSEMMSFANSTIEGRYLFSGLTTDVAPFRLGADGEVVYDGSSYELFWEFARKETGQVSLTGRDVFPLDETTNYLKGIEVPIDFEWKGRNEILEFQIGFRTVKVRIPEKWTDEITNGLDDTGDYNRFRDPNEPLDGYSLQEIADLINNSTEMGDASKLLKATVVTDAQRGVQYLKIKSLTGEPVSLTSWQETDMLPMAEGVMGAAFGDASRTATTDGKVEIRFMDNKVYSVDIKAGDDLAAITSKLNSLQDGRIWAALKTEGSNAWIDIAARNPGDKFFIDTAGGGTEIFAPGIATSASAAAGGNHVVTSNAINETSAPFVSPSGGTVIIRRGSEVYEVPVGSGSDINAIATMITSYLAALTPPVTDITATLSSSGELVVTSVNGDPFTVSATGGLVPLFSGGVSVSSGGTADSDGKYTLETAGINMATVTGEGGFYFEYDYKKYWVGISAGQTLADVAADLDTELKTVDPGASVTVKKKVGEDGTEVQWLEIKTSKPLTLSGFGSAATVIGKDVIGSESIQMNADHTHIGFAALMGMETSVASAEFSVGSVLGNTTGSNPPLQIKIVSGSRHAEIQISDDADLTLEELAARINGVCGDWFEAVVETDEPDGSDPFADPLNHSGDNREAATQRLVLRTKDGTPFSIYDTSATTATVRYGEMLGISTVLTVPNNAANPPVYPSDGTGDFDENIPAILEVTVGEKVFQVRVCKNNCPTGELVAKAIVNQVNEQYGGKLLAWDSNASGENFAVYALTGEPLRVVDKGYGDPRYADYTGGIAMDLGIEAGVISKKISDTQTAAAAGTIRISTPGHYIDVPVIAGEDMKTIANRIRESAGSWLDVSFSDTTMDTVGGSVQMSLAAKDGSAVSVFDIAGDTAGTLLGISTGLVSDQDMSGPLSFGSDDTLTITVNGATHTIDLFDGTFSGAASVVTTVEELAALINTRFQGQDIKAEVIADSSGKRLAIWSPKGYTFEISGTDAVDNFLAGEPGYDSITNTLASPNPNGTGPYNQNITSRTGDNQKKIDFFGVVDNLIDTVEGGNVDGISDKMLVEMDHWMSTLLKDRAVAGALINRYTTTESRYVSNGTNYTELYDKTVGIDLAEAITNFQMATSIYEASLAVIARIIQPSLLDFLR